MVKNLLTLIVLLLSAPVFAQTITGKVISSADEQPIPGVSILVKGSTTGTVTDAEGKYNINAPSGGVLVFSAIGFQKKEVAVQGKSIIDLRLDEDASNLNEVVVTALGVDKAQRSLGYSTATIKSDAIVRAGATNFASALYGKAPGVRIATAPGGATSAVNITIRGVNSLTGRTQPLIVLDGVPIRDGEVNNGNYWGDQRLRGNGLLDINPEDVENISILKGASAAALYGSEAVNGVVLVTTKSGKGRKGLGVDFSANYAVDNVAYLPRYQNVRGAGAPIHVSNGGQDDAGFIYYDTNGDGVKDTRGILGYSINFGPKFDGQPIMTWDGTIRPYSAQKDNYAALYRQGKTSNVNLAITQAGENYNMRFSLTRQDNQMISLGAKNAKNIANLNSSFKLGKKWSTDIMINYINQETKNRPYSIDRMINNFTGMMGRFDNGDWYLNKYKTSKGYRFVTGTGQSLTPSENIIYNGYRADILDYVWNVKENNVNEISNRVIASMTNNWQILPVLKLRGRLATDFTSEKMEASSTSSIPLSFGYSGGFSLANNLYSNIYGDLLLTFTKKLTSDLELNVMGGYTARTQKNTTMSRSTNGGLSTENMFDLAASVNTPYSGSGRETIVQDAFLGTVNLDYKNILFLEGTLRRDRYSTMHPDNNTFYYPSVNAGFVFSDMFQLPNFIDYGKLRGSWGLVGNYPSVYGANVAYSQSTLGVQQSGGSPVLYTTIPSSYGNDLIRPEQKNEVEFGLELKFFKRRLGVDVSYFNGQIQDQILPLTLAPTSGASSILSNIGTMRNSGLEVAFTTTPIETSSFRWDAGINFATIYNKVEKLANGSSELLHADYDGNAAQLRSIVGQPMGDLYAHPVATDASGRKIVNPDGLYKLDNDKMVKFGNATPKLTGGIFSTLNYKGFNLDLLADFRFGGHVMPTGINWMTSRGLTKESTKYMDTESGGLTYTENGKTYHDGMLMEGVTQDGSPNTKVISQAYYYWNTYNWGGPQYSSSRYELYIVKNTYVKMREIALGYNVPARFLAKIGTKKLNVSVFARNPFFFYRTIKDLDPEQLTAGSRWTQTITNAGTNPATRTMGVMLRASF